MLTKYGDDAKILAGGQSLIPIMKFRLASPKYLVDVKRIPELSYVKETSNGGLAIGALTPYYHVENSPLVAKKYPILTETVSGIGDMHIRNRGTVGGNLCHNDPAADLPTAMLCLKAEVNVAGPQGKRTVNIKDLLVDLFTTNLKSNEIMTEVHIPTPPPRGGGAYMKLAHVGGDFVIVSAAVMVSLDDRGKCVDASITLGGVGPVPVQATGVEKALKGQSLSDSIIEKASQNASEGVKPQSDIHAPAEYKREMTKVMTKRALTRALSRAKGGL